jgi:hypothetical protein
VSVEVTAEKEETPGAKVGDVICKDRVTVVSGPVAGARKGRNITSSNV